MNPNTALMMLAVIAAFGLATATLAVPLLPQAHALVIITHPRQCHEIFSGSDIGTCARNAPHGPP